jgi:hypothetical protein
MNAKHLKTNVCAILLGLFAGGLVGCTNTGGGTATIDPPAPLPGLPDPPAVTVPAP